MMVSRGNARTLAYLSSLLFALLVASALAWSIARSPMTLYDGLGPILDSEGSRSAAATFLNGVYDHAYFRPLRLAQIKLVYDLAGGHEFFAYKTVHVVLTLASGLLFAMLLGAGSTTELVAAVVAVMVFVGHPSFFMLVGEAYPINHFLEIVTLALLIAVLARRAGKPGADQAAPAAVRTTWWADALALGAMVAGMLTLESGLLLGVVVVVCYALGWRGVSRRAVILAMALIAAYFVWRFGVLHVGGPGLDERASGFGLQRLEPRELIARFGANPLPFYAYNVVSAALGVLFAEPRSGTYTIVHHWLDHDLAPWMIFEVISSAVTTTLVVVFGVRAVPRLWRGEADDRDRLLWLGLLLVGANAAVSYAYIKDETLSVGAAFYAAAAYAAIAGCGDWIVRRPRAAVPTAAVLAMVLVSALWTLRAAGTFYGLRSFAQKTSHDWAGYEFDRELPRDAADPRRRALYERLRATNLRVRVPNSFFTPEGDIDDIIEIR